MEIGVGTNIIELNTAQSAASAFCPDVSVGAPTPPLADVGVNYAPDFVKPNWGR